MQIIEAAPADKCHSVPILNDGRILAACGSVILIDGTEYMRTMDGWVDANGDFFGNEELRNLADKSAPVVVYNPVPVRI